MSQPSKFTRRRMLQADAGALGLSLPAWLQLQQHARADKLTTTAGKAKQCIVIYCWGGISHQSFWPRDATDCMPR